MEDVFLLFNNEESFIEGFKGNPLSFKILSRTGISFSIEEMLFGEFNQFFFEESIFNTEFIIGHTEYMTNTGGEVNGFEEDSSVFSEQIW